MPLNAPDRGAHQVLGLSVAAALFACTHETCSRMLTMWKQEGIHSRLGQRFPKGRLVQMRRARRDHDAVQPWSLMSCRISSCPGSEHMYLYSLATATPGRLPQYEARAWTSMVPAMLVPQ